MKMINNNHWKTAIIFGLSTLLAGTVQAQTAATTETPIELKYMGSKDGSPVFQINIQNEDNHSLYLSLGDANGTVLYTETIKDKNYSRNILLEGADLSDLKLSLNLYDKKKVESAVFQVNKKTSVIHDVRVAKL